LGEDRRAAQRPQVSAAGFAADGKWQDQSGNDRYTTEVVLQRFRGELQLLDSRDGGEGRDSFPEEEAPRSSGFNRAATSERRPALSGGGGGAGRDRRRHPVLRFHRVSHRRERRSAGVTLRKRKTPIRPPHSTAIFVSRTGTLPSASSYTLASSFASNDSINSSRYVESVFPFEINIL
jgi:single-stranded DNA-binding protein